MDDYIDYQCHDRTGLADHMRKNMRRNMVSGLSTNQYSAITDCALGNDGILRRGRTDRPIVGVKLDTHLAPCCCHHAGIRPTTSCKLGIAGAALAI